jgi:hypothetical protein
MPKLAKGRKLSQKQEAVIRDVVKSVNDGDSFSVARSVKKIYDVKKTSANTIASRNMKKDDFRNALMDALEGRNIIGADSKVEQRLDEGLDARDGERIDFRTRLDYVKEINKISGVYAPTQTETKSLKLNMDMSKEELENKIKLLQEELGSQ